MTYDLAILGGGPAGYTAAERALKNGLSVVLFEKEHLGGTCLNEGCIPTKALLYSAKQYHNALEAQKYGVQCEGVTFDYLRMQQRKQKIVRKLVAGVKQKVRDTTLVSGEAQVSAYDPKTGISQIQCDEVYYEAKNLLICTGSTNVEPPIPGIDGPNVWNSTQALAATELPKRIAIVGGGVIGMEFASLYNTLGAEVTVLEGTDHILGQMDREVTDLLQQTLQKNGIQFQLGALVTEITPDSVHYKTQEGAGSVDADHVLVCVGRRANLCGLDTLLQAGLEINRGIVTDDFLATNLDHVYAAGDVNGKSMLAHTAVSEAEIAVKRISCGTVDPMRYNQIPGVVYTNPEVAGIGMTEQQAQTENLNYGVAKLPMSYSGRFVAENEGVNGLCKIVYDKDTQRVMGAHLLGNGASEIINYIQQALHHGEGIEMRELTIAHPSVTEIIKETLWTL